jgi:transmembrane sensor
MNKFDKQLACKFLVGQCTAVEARRVLGWFASREGEKFLVENINNDSQLLEERLILLPRDIDSGRILRQIRLGKDRYSSGQGGDSEEDQARKTPVEGKTLALVREMPWYRLAAVFAGLVLLLAGGYAYLFASNIVTVSTAYGEVRRLTLPDHSTVTLNGNSTLRYASTWADEEPREVWLKGEAYFSVTHTEERDQLFRVNGEEQFQVEVLGTAFNVSTRESKPRVALDTGKVRLKLSGQASDTITLKPGEALEKDAQGKFIKRQVSPGLYASWKTQKLIFEDTSLHDIVLLLQETYGLSVQVADSALLQQRLTGSVPNENVDLILHGLAQLFDLTIRREKEKVYLNAMPSGKK